MPQLIDLSRFRRVLQQPFARAAGELELAACAHCRHCTGGGALMEQRIPGLSTLGSGFGCSIANTRLCTLHDRLVSPQDCCISFCASSHTD